MNRLIITPRAERDLNAIYDYVAQHNPRAAYRIIEGLRAVCDMLKRNSEAGRRRTDIGADVRSFTRGNYLVLFRTFPEGVEVVRFVDGRRNLKESL